MVGGSGQKGVMSVVYGGIVVAILTVFIIQFRPNSGQQTGSVKQQCVVTVRDRCLDPKDFGAAMGLIVTRGIDDQRLKAMGIRRQVIDGLIERTLLSQEAKRIGLSVSDDEINAELSKGRAHVSLPISRIGMGFMLGISEDMVRLLPVQGPDTKKFEYKTYQRVVRQFTNRSPTEFKAMQREEIIADRMRNLIRSRAHISDTEAFSAFVRDQSTATINYVKIKRSYVVDRYLDSSPKTVEAWAKDHGADIDKSWTSRKAEFPAGCRKARHILVKVKSDTQPMAHERDEAQGLVDKALTRVNDGERFEAVAAAMSEDDGSAEHGGDLGCFTKGKMVKAFEEAAFALKNPGDRSQIIETPFGFHIIKLDAILPEDAAKAEVEGRKFVTADLYNSIEGETLVADLAKKVREAAIGKPLEQALDGALAALDEKYPEAKKTESKDDKKKADKKEESKDDAKSSQPNRPKVELSEAFTAERQPIPDVAPGQNVARMAFSLAKPGDVPTDLVKLVDGYAVIQLKDRKPATREDFEKNREAYVAHMARLKQSDLLVEYVARLRDQARTEIRIEDRWLKEPENKNED